MATNNIDMTGGEPGIGKQLLFGLISSALGTSISPPRGPSVADQLAVRKMDSELATAAAEAKRKADAEKAMADIANFKAAESAVAAAPQRYEDSGRMDRSSLEPLGADLAGPVSTLPKYVPVARELPQEGAAERSARSTLAGMGDLDAVAKFNASEMEDATKKGFANIPFNLSSQSKSTLGIADAVTMGKLFPGQGTENVASLRSAIDRAQAYGNTNELYGLRSAEQKERDRLKAESDERKAWIKANEPEKPNARAGIVSQGSVLVNEMEQLPDVQITADDVKNVKTQKSVHDDLQTKIDRVRNLTARGIPLIGPEAEKLASAMNEVLLVGKEAANLGVLNGPDLSLMQGVYGDPASFKSKVGNAAGLKNIDEMLSGMKNSTYSTFIQRAASHGFRYAPKKDKADPITKTGDTSPAPSGGTVDRLKALARTGNKTAQSALEAKGLKW